jgi:hypothetical protein
MKRITYSAKFYIFDIILSAFVLTFSSIALFILDKSAPPLIWAFYGILTLFSLFDLFFTLWNMQWIDIIGDEICARNIFGVIKRLDIPKIRAVKAVRARAWGVKMYVKRYPCIAISSRKRINLCDIEDAYNHKKSYFIIFPDTPGNRQKLKNACSEFPEK